MGTGKRPARNKVRVTGLFEMSLRYIRRVYAMRLGQDVQGAESVLNVGHFCGSSKVCSDLINSSVGL